MKRILSFLLLSLTIAYVISACKPTKNEIPDGGFPTEIANILVAKCAVSGCHNSASYTNANNLRLDSWEAVFKGSSSGAVVVPYGPQYSSLLYFVNTDSTRGVVAGPTMPLSDATTKRPLLTSEEYNALKNWIANGAPDKNGNVAFASDADTRQKIYITQQGADEIAVVDGKSHLVMRYISIGTNAGTLESPHSIRMSADGTNAYVAFLGGFSVQKIDVKEDKVLSSFFMGYGAWNILFLAPADTAMVISNWQGNGSLAYLNAVGMNQYKNMYSAGSLLVYPHGIASNRSFDTFWVTAQYGNCIYKLSSSQLLYKKISLDGNPAVAASSSDATSPDPHEIVMTPDYSRYFVTCSSSHQVKVLTTFNDSVIATIPVGLNPQEIAISKTRPYIFVTCTEDVSSFAGMKGSVYAINYNTLEVTKIDGDFYQPHAITVDDQNASIYVVSTNASPTGPLPHHGIPTKGRAGWYSVIDLNTFEPVTRYRYQVLELPYSAAVRYR